MANFDQLKQSVAALIRTNGAEEITGQIMQDVLLTIINSISGGYMFGGVAQHNGNVGNPDYNVFFLAGSGAYTGYGGAITIENGCYGVFRYNGSWTQEVVDIGVRLSGSVTAGETRGCTGDTINTALQQLFDNITSILDTMAFVYNTPSAQQATKAMLDVQVTVGGNAHVLGTLTLVAATALQAGLMSAEDKKTLDGMLNNMSFEDTTAGGDVTTKITEALQATIGGNAETLATFTILAATASKAGLMSADDKATLDKLVAMLGYYVCDTAAGTAAKTVSASGYSLTNGGCIRIKMNNANTASNVTLNINGTGAKALYYDGVQASSSNSWEAGDILEVFYDGTQYQCASGGGGKFATGEKVKDTSISDEVKNDGSLITGMAVFPMVAKIAEAEGILPVTPFSTTWESGTTRNTDGALVADTNTIRTTYIDVTGKEKMTFLANNLPEGWAYSIKPTLYTENKTLVETPSWTAKSTQLTNISIPVGVTYVIVVVALYNVNDIQQALTASAASTYGFVVCILQEPSDWYKLLEKAGNIDAVSQKIAEAEGYVNPMQGVSYVQGSTYNTTGADAADSNTIRSNYIDLTSIDKLYLAAYNMPEGSSLMIKPTWYNSSQALLETPVWSNEATSFDIDIPSGAGYLRLVIAKRVNSATVKLTPLNVEEYQINLGTGDSEWFRLLQRVDDISDATNDNVRKSNPFSIKVVSYNIGHFCHGAAQNSNITSSTYATQLAAYRNLINTELNADLIGLCEYSAIFGKNTDNVDVLAKDVLFTRYGFPFADFLQSRYSCNALYSRVYVDNVKRQIYECNQTAVITHTTAIKATDYYYIEADLWMAGKLVKLVMTHLAFDNNNPQVVADQISELITKFANTERVVLMGDWNVSDFSQFAPFTAAGYTLGNDGTIMTYPDRSPEKALDNIIVKGIEISNVGVVQTSGLSDHLPLYATITLP